VQGQSQRKKSVLVTASGSNAPVSCWAWGAAASCELLDSGIKVQLHMKPHGVPKGIYFRCSYTTVVGEVALPQVHRQLLGSSQHVISISLTSAVGLPWMKGDGWDEAAWAAAGLPTTGDLLLRLRVHSVQ
jgi:hypothetical protein